MQLDHLNPAQRAAVEKTDGPVMILAGAGSGKTRTLVSRIQYLLEDRGISAYQILAVTFSNKAAQEMRERISKVSGIDIGALGVTTFHAFCSKLLRSEANYLGLSRNFTIYDQGESKSVVKTILGRRGINFKEMPVAEVQYYIEGLKNAGHYINRKSNEWADPIDKNDIMYDYFCDYETELHRSNALDFGGLITATLNLLENFPEVLERYRKRFKYILVDEYQDTNRAQFRLIQLLSEGHHNICVVGDEDQSIYSWRGADIRNIMDFEQLFPDATLIKLEQNYRSSKKIIEAATEVIANNLQRKGKEMWTDNNPGEDIYIVECADDRAEAQYVASEISKLLKTITADNIAVFYRNNAQSRTIEDALRLLNIRYKVIAGIKFYERKEIKDLVSYLRLIVNDKDSLALARVINAPVRGIGATTLRKLEDEAVKEQISLWEIMQQIVDNPENYSHLKLGAKIRGVIANFVELIQEAKIATNNQKLPSEIYDKILNESGYLEALAVEGTHEAKARIENLEELMTAIVQYETNTEAATLAGFLEVITLDANSDESSDEDGQQHEVSLMTIHGAKGLEYEYVFVVGAEESIFPTYRSMESGDFAIEEERRLFYVAMTRAMQKLYIMYAQGRMLWGSIKFNPPSRFIDEIPAQYCFRLNKSKERQSANFETGRRVEYSNEFNQSFDQSNDWDKTYQTFSPDKPLSSRAKFPQGSRVRHSLYGNGVVQKSEGVGQDEKVVIQFNDGQLKKFLVKFAPLELVS